MAKKLDFLMVRGTQKEALKARIFQGVDLGTYVDLDGGPFNGIELSMSGLNALIEILTEVREAALKGLDD